MAVNDLIYFWGAPPEPYKYLPEIEKPRKYLSCLVVNLTSDLVRNAESAMDGAVSITQHFGEVRTGLLDSITNSRLHFLIIIQPDKIKTQVVTSNES